MSENVPLKTQDISVNLQEKKRKKKLFSEQK